MGDDCAVTDGRANLLTCDSLVFGRHFDADCPPELAGEKLLKRNLSDIAAMGGIPADALVAMFMPGKLSIEWLARFTKGLARAALRYNTNISGGDIAQSDGFLGATLTLSGRAARPLRRGTAGAGDLLYVTGPLGGSIRGHHLTFEPRLEQGMFLARIPAVTACMDLTDGLAKDAPSLCGPGLAAALDLDALPPSVDALEIAGADAKDLLAHMLCDGEDYELLFALKAEAAEEFERDWEDRFSAPPFRIGHVAERADGGPQLIDANTGKALTFSGYEHLRQA
jgi:thiamine-monophosphate kinase